MPPAESLVDVISRELEYETSRGRALSPEERRVAAASADYLIAQVARLEQASGLKPGDNYLGLLRDCAQQPLI